MEAAPPLSWPQRAIAALLLAILGLPLLLLALAGPLPALRAVPLHHETPPSVALPVRWSALRSGTFQRQLDALLAERLPPRRVAVQLANQLYYGLGRSYMYNGVIQVGRSGTLFEIGYIRAWCSGGVDAALLARRADRIAELRDWFSRDGRALIVLITPSKAAVVPELTPPFCQGTPDPDGRHRAFADLLAQRHVPFIDGHDAAMAMKQVDPLPPFPRGGTHWSMLASRRIAGRLLEEASRLAGADLGGLAVSGIDWQSAPVDQDRDLAALLNLYAPPFDYPVGQGRTACRATAAGRASRLLGIGGSFLGEPLRAIGECGLFGQVDYLLYYDQFRVQWPGGRRFDADRAALAPGWPERLAGTRVLVLEINEAVLDGRQTHLERFLDDALPRLR